MIYSKTLDVLDYNLLGKELKVVNDCYEKIKAVCRFEHEHRKWEYALALKFLQENCCNSVLEVGGGGSLFQPMLVGLGFNVVELEYSDQVNTLIRQAKILNIKHLEYERTDFFDWRSERKFDAVISLSVIEHAVYHHEFFIKLLSHVKVGGVAFITFDFHPSGKALVSNHERTYSIDEINELIKTALPEKVTPILPLSYDSYEPNIYNQYTFASLALQKFSK